MDELTGQLAGGDEAPAEDIPSRWTAEEVLKHVQKAKRDAFSKGGILKVRFLEDLTMLELYIGHIQHKGTTRIQASEQVARAFHRKGKGVFFWLGGLDVSIIIIRYITNCRSIIEADVEMGAPI